MSGLAPAMVAAPDCKFSLTLGHCCFWNAHCLACSGEPGAYDILCNPLDISRGFYSYCIAMETEGPICSYLLLFQSTSSLCIRHAYSSSRFCARNSLITPI